MMLSPLSFPPPYRAGLAISNDLDDLREPAGWWEFLRFLNTEDATRFGPGLDLEIGDSFWLFSDDPDGQPASYFRGLTGEPSPFASYLAVLGRAGYLDTLHSYGNFSRHGGFTRNHAVRAARVFDEEGFQPTVWVNHGGAHDFQNLWMGCGDLLENPEAEGAPCPEYHLDLTWSRGFRYAWIGELTRIPGQGRSLTWKDWADPGSEVASEFLGWARRSLSRRMAYRDVLATYPHYPVLGNRLLTPRRLRDGRTVQTFVRGGDFQRASFSDLAWLLRSSYLDRLTRSGGASVLFVHWSKHPGRSFTDLDPRSLAALRDLAARARARDLWVTTTSRLLTYLEARDAVRCRVHSTAEGARLELTAEPLPDGRTLQRADLAGISFPVEDPARATATWQGEALPVEAVPESPEPAVRVPWARLEFPEPPGGTS